MTKRRADFAHNREAIMEAAHEVFAEKGVNAPLDAIAQKAGVGRATFFRHFSDRRELIDALLDREITRLEGIARETPLTDESLFVLTEIFFADMIRYAVIADYLRAQDSDDEKLALGIDRLHAIFRPSFDLALKAGLVREDLRVGDIVIFAVMLSAAATTPHIGPEGMKRAYSIVFEGIRPQAGT
ncbi:MAG: TetR/AcrR family transcriptional regulator [Maritimibacter sp.]